MPFLSSIAGLSARALGFVWGALTNIFDNWVSNTPRSLGDSTSGSPWTVVQGAWTASGTANPPTAVTSTASSSFPLATVPLNQNVQSSIQDASAGSGLVFWETDAGDWWASIVNATTASVATGSYCISSPCCTGCSTCGCTMNSCCTGSNTCVALTCCTCGSCASGYSGPTPGSCVCTNNVSGGTYSSCISSACCTGSNTCAGGTLPGGCCSTYSTCTSEACCSSGTTYTTYYYWGLAIIKSVAAAISTVVSTTISTVTSTAAMIQSLSLTVTGSNIATQAYSDTALSTPTGSALTTTGTPGGTNVGIIVAPANQGAATAGSGTYLQGDSVGQFNAH